MNAFHPGRSRARTGVGVRTLVTGICEAIALVCVLSALVSPVAARQSFGPPRPSATQIYVVDVEAKGELELVLADGSRSRPKAGFIELWSRYHVAWHRHEIPVVDGRWTALVPSPVAWAVVGRVVLDGREAYVERGGWDDIPPSRIAWTARLVAPVSLTTVDSASGEPIPNFEVREWDRATPPLDALDGWIVTSSSSGSFPLPAWGLDPDPEALTGHAWSAKRSFWVRAKESAWTRVEADFARGGNVVARLGRAVSLRVKMSPSTVSAAKDALAWFEIDIAGVTASKPLNVPRHEIEMTGLTPGEVTLRWLVQNDSPRKPPRVLALRKIQLAAGPSTTVEF